MTTDSRWSARYGRFLIYVDDARFEKIERYQTSVFMFAGNGQKIQSWKSWIRTNPTDDSGMPDHQEMCVCIADLPSKGVLLAKHQDIVRNGGYFTGTGSLYAFTCWSENHDAVKAVETAKLFDFSSGGDVKFVDFDSGQNNLFSPTREINVADVSQALADRGNIMEIAVNNRAQVLPFKLADLAANDAELREVQKKIASGEIAPTAPCDGMYSEWTDDDKLQLKGALAKVFGWKK